MASRESGFIPAEIHIRLDSISSRSRTSVCCVLERSLSVVLIFSEPNWLPSFRVCWLWLPPTKNWYAIKEYFKLHLFLYLKVIAIWRVVFICPLFLALGTDKDWNIFEERFEMGEILKHSNIVFLSLQKVVIYCTHSEGLCRYFLWLFYLSLDSFLKKHQEVDWKEAKQEFNE